MFVILSWSNDGFAQTGRFVPEMEAVDRIFSDFMGYWDIPGGSIAIVKDGRLVYARGFGYADRESNELVQPHHLFRVASVSKPITSIAILKLVDQGQISLDAEVFGAEGILNSRDYSTIRDAKVKGITLQHLLHHTSGWGYIDGRHDPMFVNKLIAQRTGEEPPVGASTIIRFMLTSQTLDNDPGAEYFYSNFGYCILGRVIAEVTRRGYEDYVKNEILDPIGISTMQVARNQYENKASDEVKYYDFAGSPLVNSVYGMDQPVPMPYGGFNIEAMDSHGGWIASAIDLVKLLVAVDGFDTKPDILSQSSIQLMTMPSEANRFYGLGWAVNSSHNWWHTGSLPGTSSILVRTSRGLGWAVLFNSRPSDWQDFNNSMDEMVWNAIRGVDVWPAHDLFEQFYSAITATKLGTISGDNQQGNVGAALALPFVVSVKDQNGSVIEGVVVTFAVTAGGGTLSVETDTTDANGRAQTVLRLGSGIGTNIVVASVSGVDQTVTFTSEALATSDFDGDGAVGFRDFVLFARNFGLSKNDDGFDTRFDLNADGEIGFQDFVAFARDFGKTVTYN